MTRVGDGGKGPPNIFQGRVRAVPPCDCPGRTFPNDHKRNFLRKTLLASTCLAPMTALPLHAQTTIRTPTTPPDKTSIAKSGTRDDSKNTKAGPYKNTNRTP